VAAVRLTGLRQGRVAKRRDEPALIRAARKRAAPGGPPKRPAKAEAGHYDNEA